MPDKCSGTKLGVGYLETIEFWFPMTYYALLIGHFRKIQSYHYTWLHMYNIIPVKLNTIFVLHITQWKDFIQNTPIETY